MVGRPCLEFTDAFYTDLSPTLLSFFILSFSALIFSIGYLALIFQNNIPFLLIFSDMDNRQKMTLVLNIKYFYIQIHKYVVLPLACLYPYLLMFVYTATISKNLGPTGLLPNQLTSRLGWNFTYNNVSDRSTNELEASQLTSCNHPLRILGIQKILRKSLKCLDCKYPKAKF